jgi:outer membrane immunogenic protein
LKERCSRKSPAGGRVAVVAVAVFALGLGLRPAPVAAAPSGLRPYAGITLGYGAAGDDRVGLNPPGLTIGTLDNSGPVAGAMAGLGGQVRGLDYGFEVEGLFADVADATASGGIAARSRMTGSLALRARLGIPLGDATIFATAGPTLGRFDYAVSGGGIAIDESFTRLGYSLGLGWERPLSERLSLRGDYIYSNFGTEVLTDSVSGAATRATPVNHRLSLTLLARF